jgi:hypothetical protein
MMKFACLGYIDETHWDSLPKSEQDALVNQCFDYDNDLQQNGHWVDGGQALQSVRTAKTLRWKERKVLVTDGPFAETKEQLGGIGMLEARDMDHAVELMSEHPGVRVGPFELRPVDEELTDRCKSKSNDTGAQSGETTVVCLGCGNESVWTELSQIEQETLIEECLAYDDVLRNYGRMVGGEALQGGRTAKTLRWKSGKVMVTDGPYAETKEQIGGVAILKFRDMDQAVEAWSKHPCLRMGDALELRPVDEKMNAKWEARKSQLETFAAR